MKKSQRLEPVIKVAKNSEERAAKALCESRDMLEKNEAKLAELLAYQQEYTKRYEDVGRNGMQINRINEFRQFLVKLNEAISNQREIIRLKQSELDNKNDIWVKTRVKHKSIDKIVSRHRSNEQRGEDRKEQAETDDRSQHVKTIKD